MSFIRDVDNCVAGAGMPKPSEVFSGAGLKEIVEICGILLKAAKLLGVEVSFADLVAAGGATVLAGAAADVAGELAAMAGTLVVSVYVGACLTCVGKAALLHGLGDELASADDGEAKDIAITAMNEADPASAPA